MERSGVQLIAMLSEAMLASARVARRFDERVERPDRSQLRIEKPLAKAGSGNEQLARPDLSTCSRASRLPARLPGALGKCGR